MCDDLAVAFRTLGCKVNRVESDTIAAELLGRGVRLVEEDAAAVIIVNTCTVTGEADAKARKAVRQALKAAGAPVVVVTGCLAAIDPDALRALGERVVVEADKEAVAARVADALRLAPVQAGEPRVTSAPARSGDGFRTRVPVKIQDGCDNHCSYCIVPHARGVLRSRPAADVIAEVESLVAAGTREVVLTGINLGRYADGVIRLPELLRAIAETGIARVRMSSIEPPDVTDALVRAIAANPAVCEHLHVPLQSGSDAVLRAMGRKYSTADFAERLRHAREALPGLAVTTDVICGFPGETDEDHATTIAFCERMGFSKMHVFRYSVRAGTPAAEMPNQLAAEVKAQRAAELRRLDAGLQQRFAESRVGQQVAVLVERVDGAKAEGTTREYLHVRMPAGEASVGELVEVRLTREMLG